MTIRDDVKRVIRDHHLEDWLGAYPWLTGCLGDPSASIWFIGENPSLAGVEAVDKRSRIKSENLQWNSHDGDRLFREAIVEAGLKAGLPEAEGGWRCYVTNAIKAPEVVALRNKKKSRSRYWKEQAEIWLPVLQRQIDSGKPKVLVALGEEVFKIVNYMKSRSLRCPPLEKISHYSYVMFRPEAGSKRGPIHHDRILEFKRSIHDLAQRYYA